MVMNKEFIDNAIAEIEELSIHCANGDGDCADMPRTAEDKLLFQALKAIAQGVPNAQKLAAYVIDSCASRLEGRCRDSLEDDFLKSNPP